MATTCGYCNTPIEETKATYDPTTGTYLHMAGNTPWQIIDAITSKDQASRNCVGGYIKKSTLEGRSVCLNPVDVSTR